MLRVILFKHRLQLVTLDPVVFQGLLWIQALLRVYYQTFFDKVYEIFITFAIEGAAYRVAPFASAFGHTATARPNQPPLLVKEILPLVALINHGLGRHANSDDKEL